MNENCDARDAQIQGLEEARNYIDLINGLREDEKDKLKNNIQHPGIQERILAIKYTLEETDSEAAHRAGILLESLRSDIRDFP